MVNLYLREGMMAILGLSR